MTQNNKAVDAANRRFEREFMDITGDDSAYALAKNIAADKWRKNPKARPWDIASETGYEIRQIRENKHREDAIAEMRRSRGQNGKGY